MIENKLKYKFSLYGENFKNLWVAIWTNSENKISRFLADTTIFHVLVCLKNKGEGLFTNYLKKYTWRYTLVIGIQIKIGHDRFYYMTNDTAGL